MTGTDPDPPALHPTQQPPIDRFCDVVLKGGVTDGVIYPWAIMALAHQYRFKNIAGTSVGALAAALTAAAEYSRRYGSVQGFNKVMLDIPKQLAATQANGHTKLYSLFQPSTTTRRLFEVFVVLFSTPMEDTDPATSGGLFTGTAWIVIRTVLKAYRPWAWGGVVIGALTAWTLTAGITLPTSVSPWLQWLALAGLCSVVGVITLFAIALLLVWGLWRDVTHGLVPEGYGLCTGKQTEADPHKGEKAPQGLIEWLHEGIQAAAGRPLNQPLTFEDLWNAPSGPSPATKPEDAPGHVSRSIDLRMVTTNLTQGRPYGLPLSDSSSRLFFRREEFERYFPQEVMAHLLEHAKPYGVPPKAQSTANGPNHPFGHDYGDRYADYLELPQAKLPILVATRLSLSFPILFKAVPLWALKPNPLSADEPFYRCWFSDGGICSNFPIHQFDAPLPRWPTFGITLDKPSEGLSNPAVWMTAAHNDGLEDTPPLSPTPAGGLRQLSKFLGDILYTAKDWNDNTSVRLPGVRDRVVHVALGHAGGLALGGLNLKLSGQDIMTMARDYGYPAGLALVNKFIHLEGQTPACHNASSTAWREHRWVRFNSFVTALRSRMMGFDCAAQGSDYAGRLSEQIADACIDQPLHANGEGDEGRLTTYQAHALHQAHRALTDLEARLTEANTVQPYEPCPLPELHMRAPL